MNTIVICLDTLRWDALGCYFPHWIRTPFIDRFAASATRFDDAHCASFPTIPMRVDCYTGEVNWPCYGWKGPLPDQPTLPELLRENGFYSGIVLDTTNHVRTGLLEVYDECHIIDKPEPGDGVTTGDINVPVPSEHFRQNASHYRGDRARRSHYRCEEDWFVSRTMRKACRWLEENAKRDKWFLWIDTFEIHEDWMPPKHYVDLYAKDYDGPDYTYPNYGYTDIYSPDILQHLRDCYAGEVTLTDRWVGHLLYQIELLGLFENTCIVILSDHGMYIGEHNRTGKHTVDPDDPWPIYDEVGKIPLLVKTPITKSPRNIDALCQPADLLPTVLELAGMKAPESTGKSIVPLLTGESVNNHDRIFTTYYSGSGPGGSESTQSHITVTSPAHTAIFGRAPHRPEIYDRKADPLQQNNIAEKEPHLVDGLRADLIAFMQRRGAEAAYIDVYAKGETSLY